MANHHEKPPQVAKKPRLFYYEDSINARCPVPEKLAAMLIEWCDLCDGDDTTLELYRRDMTDAEFAALPTDD